MSDEIRETLNQRGTNYGTFMDNATISEKLMEIISSCPGWQNFQPDQRAATWIMMQKLSRALSGNAQYDDNWRDIAGYAQLIVDRINGTGCYAPHINLDDTACFQVNQLVEPSDCRAAVPFGELPRCDDCLKQIGYTHSSDCDTLRRKTASDLGGSTGS